MAKNIYFIRHGESEGNVSDIRLPETSPLTELGRKQAEYAAKRAAKLPIDAMFASTMVRAQETARIISEKTGKDFESFEFFKERIIPSSHVGKPKDDPLVVEERDHIQKNFGVPGFKHSDEETFDDLKNRASATLDFLASRPEENILVVTHGWILRVILSYVIFGETLTADECDKILGAFRTNNTGITLLKHDETKEKPWKLWIWNDHAHLG
ncbi:MAG: hypothetical protein A2931_02060 [Candidatus Niyogibacteria bacterium RIFCSPLOWO2_01_FULL_45_48]|uniref:Phosphoglycerate mutase n=2 Tax=Candidatus Niyogiibacteriota TaxID=1817912 RepID=A0A1G2EZL4_9BACT|nr:MAG: hypothetical protein A2835_02665 [Candidatus Niyogibacteria bacterium RIFCSPHIGHO2_01_FULL_45_28]OGZ30680.1 MAG: hypothetical protein A2931_02060 [Candidatus Niyogibacteria bacterium RIFCSPLOWO2_01_FULL_45_48]OGZ31239.1 MAG: hypothetical protein A3J00_01700 [Candidatus Niyogibacteria bacterium RIFCSPLOWO2_02_FULL_45_13]